MSTDAWLDSLFAGDLLPDSAPACRIREPLTDSAAPPDLNRLLSGAGTVVTAVPDSAAVGQSPTADPLLVVGTVLELLAARGVAVVVDHSLDCAVEAAARLLRCLGVEALDAWAVAP